MRSITLIASSFAIWLYSKVEDDFYLLAGSVEFDGAGTVDGVGNEVRFNEISGIVGTKNGQYAFVCDRYGKTISKITISSGAVTRQRTYTNVNRTAGTTDRKDGSSGSKQLTQTLHKNDH